MKTISERQGRLLASAMNSPLGLIPLGERASVTRGGNSLAALVRHGLMVVVEGDDGVRSMSITPAGREAMVIKPSPDRTRRKVKRASRIHDAIAGLEPPEPPESDAEITAREGPRGRIGAMYRLMVRPEGASVSELMATTGWLAHSVRAAISSLRARRGYPIDHLKGADGGRYRILQPPPLESEPPP